jgi:hypothetical protein
VLDAFDERLRLPQLPDEGSLRGDLVAYVVALNDRCSDPSFRAFIFELFAAMKADVSLLKRLGPDFRQRRSRNRGLIERAVARGELPPEVDGDAILDAVLKLRFAWMGRGEAPSLQQIERAIEQVIAQARTPAQR